jgi:hypothetical protein
MKPETQIKAELEAILSISSEQEMLTRMREYLNGLSDAEHEYASECVRKWRIVADTLFPKN